MYKAQFVIYMNLREGSVIFSDLYPTFNSAKDNIDSFLENYAKKLGKKIIFLSKEDLENLKFSKKIEDFFYVRRKNSQAVIYTRLTLPGTFYNSYSIEKYGNVNINEFLFSDLKNETEKEEVKGTGEIKGTERKIYREIQRDIQIQDLHVTNRERGSHVNVISELKNVLSKRENKNVSFNIPEKEDENIEKKQFIVSLQEGKKKLRNVTPPMPRKYLLDYSSKDTY